MRVGRTVRLGGELRAEFCGRVGRCVGRAGGSYEGGVCRDHGVEGARSWVKGRVCAVRCMRWGSRVGKAERPVLKRMRR